MASLLCLRSFSKATICFYYGSQITINSSPLTMVFRIFSFQRKRSVSWVSNMQPSRRLSLTSVLSCRRERFQHEHPQRSVLLVDEIGGNQGEMSFEQALQMAKEKSLELVRVNTIKKDDSVNMPVYRLMSTGRHTNIRTRARSLEDKPPKTKTIKVNDRIEFKDLFFRIKRIEGYLEKGYQVKLCVKSKKGGSVESTSDDKLNIIKQVGQEMKVNYTTGRPVEESKGLIVCVFKPA